MNEPILQRNVERLTRVLAGFRLYLYDRGHWREVNPITFYAGRQGMKAAAALERSGAIVTKGTMRAMRVQRGVDWTPVRSGEAVPA